jgi:hypothetical protein
MATASSTLQAKLFNAFLSEEEAVKRFKAMRAEYQAFFSEADEAVAREHNLNFIKSAVACLRAALEIAKERLHFLDTHPDDCPHPCRAIVMQECLHPLRNAVVLYPDFHGFQRAIKAHYPRFYEDFGDFDWMAHVLELEAALREDEAKALRALCVVG